MKCTMEVKDIKDILHRFYKALYTVGARFNEDPYNEAVVDTYLELNRKFIMLTLTSYNMYDLKTYKDITHILNEDPISALLIHEYITDENVLEILLFNNQIGQLN